MYPSVKYKTRSATFVTVMATKYNVPSSRSNVESIGCGEDSLREEANLESYVQCHVAARTMTSEIIAQERVTMTTGHRVRMG